MGKCVENPKRSIISCRVDDRELEAIQELSRRTGIKVSDLVRHTLLLLEDDSVFLKAANG